MRIALILILMLGLLAGCTHDVRAYDPADMAFFGDTSQLPPGAKPVVNKTGAVISTPAEQAQALKAYLAKLEQENKQVVLAVARVQGPGFTVPGTQVWGRGNFRLVTGKGVELTSDVEKLSKLPGIKRAVQITELNVPVTLVNDGELRLGANELGADLLLVYTIGSKVTQSTDKATASPQASARSSAQAVLLDVKSGQVFSLLSSEVKLVSSPFMPVTPDVNIGLIEQSQRIAFAGMIDATEKAFAQAK